MSDWPVGLSTGCFYQLSVFQRVRINSGDLGRRARAMFDEAGLREVPISASGHDDPQKGQPLLIPVLRNGRRLDLAKPLCASREYVKDQLARLPKRLRTLDQVAPFTVKFPTRSNH
jgi:hypothetical protein